MLEDFVELLVDDVEDRAVLVELGADVEQFFKDAMPRQFADFHQVEIDVEPLLGPGDEPFAVVLARSRGRLFRHELVHGRFDGEVDFLLAILTPDFFLQPIGELRRRGAAAVGGDLIVIEIGVELLIEPADEITKTEVGLEALFAFFERNAFDDLLDLIEDELAELLAAEPAEFVVLDLETPDAVHLARQRRPTPFRLVAVFREVLVDERGDGPFGFAKGFLFRHPRRLLDNRNG